mmetsp:Transcript_41843/g.68234  ORF Transcript_41843/g.68234 Transcript_41843/m.68234 type:complete len:231 (-) Transcript_41843:192-884(-)
MGIGGCHASPGHSLLVSSKCHASGEHELRARTAHIADMSLSAAEKHVLLYARDGSARSTCPLATSRHLNPRMSGLPCPVVRLIAGPDKPARRDRLLGTCFRFGAFIGFADDAHEIIELLSDGLAIHNDPRNPTVCASLFASLLMQLLPFRALGTSGKQVVVHSCRPGTGLRGVQQLEPSLLQAQDELPMVLKLGLLGDSAIFPDVPGALFGAMLALNRTVWTFAGITIWQ